MKLIYKTGTGNIVLDKKKILEIAAIVKKVTADTILIT